MLRRSRKPNFTVGSWKCFFSNVPSSRIPVLSWGEITNHALSRSSDISQERRFSHSSKGMNSPDQYRCSQRRFLCSFAFPLAVFRLSGSPTTSLAIQSKCAVASFFRRVIASQCEPYSAMVPARNTFFAERQCDAHTLGGTADATVFLDFAWM